MQTAALIRRAVGFLGIDSGPAHLANALERPSVVLPGRYRGVDRYLPYTGFLRENAVELVGQWDGPIASLPVDVSPRGRKKFSRPPRRRVCGIEMRLFFQVTPLGHRGHH
ncbi:MAG TPA: glycosyltransferase family 9 protein [Opitutaceae bacterium]|nr:glycosyltransferase family 9 protein [Opitutaceae bacterium]